MAVSHAGLGPDEVDEIWPPTRPELTAFGAGFQPAVAALQI